MKIEARDFDLEATLESGQVFGFTRQEHGCFRGFIGRICVDLFMEGSFLHVLPAEGRSQESPGVSDREIRDFFDLDRDLRPLYGILSEDRRLKPAVHFSKGLRVIRQDPWLALGCFILSSNNNIKRIQGMYQNLSWECTGDPYRFPDPRTVHEKGRRFLKALGLGYRAPYLFASAERIFKDPESFYSIRILDYREGKARLLELEGVGEKVADCVLLFGFEKHEAFPVDVWILRTMRKLYFRDRRVSPHTVRAFAQTRWGRWAGYVQQFLYHGAKKGLL